MLDGRFIIRKIIKCSKAFLIVKLIWILLCIFSSSLPCTVLVGTCNAESISSNDLTELSIRDLMEIEITTGSKKSQKLSNTAAAAFVISQEDIRRSGVTSIAEALRMVPGLEVARIDANKWAISSRGFNGRYANKLLVLMDGRSVYTPLCSGVFWDIQDTLLEDIDRIEVIRGPGAALWGANAVNGVINIITKNSHDTKGGLVSAGAGKEERGFGNFRFGDSLGENATYRFFGKYYDRDEAKLASGRDAADDWDIYTYGFRTDWNPTAMDSVMFQGNHYRSDDGQTMTVPSLSAPYTSTFSEDAKADGTNFLFRWNRTLSEKSDMSLQIYYDRTRQQQTVLSDTRDTYDFDLQHRFFPWEKHEVLWGIGYRHTSDDTKSSFAVSVAPASSTDELFSAFIQNDITIIEDYLRLTLGAKIEHNDYTGFEFQPNIKTLFTPDKNNSLWASFARAVRTPSRAERDTRANVAVIPAFTPPNISSLPALVSFVQNKDFTSETVLAYEIGYRNQMLESLSVDIAAFYNKYDKLRSNTYQSPYIESSTLPAHIVIPFITSNDIDGHNYGIELSAEWKPLEWWKINPAYTYLYMNLTSNLSGVPSGSSDTDIPSNQFSLRSSMDLPKGFELDLWLRYVDDLSDTNVDGYCMIDARLGWKPTQNLEISLVGQNLSDKQHPEFSGDYVQSAKTEVEHSYYLKATWHF